MIVSVICVGARRTGAPSWSHLWSIVGVCLLYAEAATLDIRKASPEDAPCRSDRGHTLLTSTSETENREYT
jgi:hypothetical protein